LQKGKTTQEDKHKQEGLARVKGFYHTIKHTI